MHAATTGGLVALAAVAALIAVPDLPDASSDGSLPGSARPVATQASSDPADDAVERVVVISVDALNPGAIIRLGDRVPNLQRLRREGASTLQARTLFEQTNTLPNHVGMLTSLRVNRGTNVTFNSDNGGTLHQTAGRYVPSIFDVAHDAGLRTGLYTVKDKFNFIARSYDATHGAADSVGTDQGTAKLDRYVYREGNETAVVDAFLADLASNAPAVSLVHLAEPDRVGHADGGMTPTYLEAVVRSDALIGRILTALDGRPAQKRSTLVLVVSDHGTAGTQHWDNTVLANYRVPFVAWGPGVPAGANLYRLNPGREFPGRRRISYAGTQPIRNSEVANLVADELDLPALAGSTSNRRQGLRLR